MRALVVAGAVLSVAALALAKPPPIVPEPLLAACVDKPAGAPCTVAIGGTAKTGTCVKLQDATLVCMQPRRPKP
jgi:hypothetical protein